MPSYPKGQLAFVCGMILVIGHFITFILIWRNSSISPSAKSDIVAMIVPITAASVTSAVLYASKHSEIDLRATPPVNAFFIFVSIIIPLMLFSILMYGIFHMDGEGSVNDFKAFIISAEAMFGGLLVIVTEALFGTHAED